MRTKSFVNSIKPILARFAFKTIYKVYLWASRLSGESFIGSRLVEYPFVIENLNIPKGRKVLIVGCAGDPLSTILPALNYKTYGLDIKHVSVKYHSFHFIRSDIRNTKIPDSHFDAVVAVSTIEHVGIQEGDYDGDRKAIKEIMRILKPEGILLMTIPIASKYKVKTLERIYNPESLNLLLRGLRINKMTFYRRDKHGYWIKCSTKELSDPDTDEAIALVVAMKSE